jgi:hypothetical protein
MAQMAGTCGSLTTDYATISNSSVVMLFPSKCVLAHPRLALVLPHPELGYCGVNSTTRFDEAKGFVDCSHESNLIISQPEPIGPCTE